MDLARGETQERDLGYKNHDLTTDLHDQVQRITDTLARLQRRFGANDPEIVEPVFDINIFKTQEGAGDAPHLYGLAVALTKEREARDTIFEYGLFSDPAWYMLLDLYIQRARNRQVSISSAAIGARTAATTGLRWVNLLILKGLVERFDDPLDRRRGYVGLTQTGLEQVERSLRATRTAFAALANQPV